MARICEVLREVELAVRVVRQDCWEVLAVVVKLTELPVVVFAGMRVKASLDSLRAVVKLWLDLELVRIHYFKIYN